MTRATAPRSNAQRRRRNWILIAVVLVIMVVTRLSGMPERLPTPYFDLPRPIVIAHQGGNLLRPGNTLMAFDHAVNLGADVLEMDLHLSRDGHVVVIHDATVDRTTDGAGAVRDLELAQLQALDAAFHWPFDAQATPHRGQGVWIPTLVEVLQRYPAQRLVLELKADEAELAAAVCSLLQANQQARMTLVASFHQGVLDQFRAACPEVATSASADEVESFLFYRKIGLLRLFMAPALALQLGKTRDDVNLLDPDVVRDANAWHLQVDYWTLNDPVEMRTAIRAGAQGVITDRPDLLLDELGRL